MQAIELALQVCTVIGIFLVLGLVVAAGFVAWDIRLIKRGK